MTDNEMLAMTPVKVAFIIDNVVADVLHTDERLAAIFLSNPVVIDITNLDIADSIRTNSEYDPTTNTFTPAEEITDLIARGNAQDPAVEE
jgi:hypothetical protein